MDTKIEDSNLAFIGSDEDKAARKVRESSHLYTMIRAWIHSSTSTNRLRAPRAVLNLKFTFQTMSDCLLPHIDRPLRTLKLTGRDVDRPKVSRFGVWRISVLKEEMQTLALTSGRRVITESSTKVCFMGLIAFEFARCALCRRICIEWCYLHRCTRFLSLSEKVCLSPIYK